MKYFTRFLAWIKENWFLILFAIFLSFAMWVHASKIDSISKQFTESRLALREQQPDAVYLKGSSCVIRATPDVSKQVFMDLAMDCARKHEEFLLQTKDSNEKTE